VNVELQTPEKHLYPTLRLAEIPAIFIELDALLSYRYPMQEILMVHSLQGGLTTCANIDTAVAHWLRAQLTPASTEALLAVTTLGSEIWIASILLLTLGILAWKKRWHKCAALFLTVPGGTMLGQLMKHLVQRPRPFVSGPIGEWGGYSFPSGHTLAATLLYGFLLVVLLPKLPRKRWRAALLASGAALILGVAYSRMALGAHYLTDVTAAMIFGGAWVLISWRVAATFRRPVPATA
jgi:undecaprenyl-diphosphatase